MRGGIKRRQEPVLGHIRDAIQSKAVPLCFLGMGGLTFGLIAAITGAEGDLIGILEMAYLLIIFLWLLTTALLERKRMAGLEKLLENLPEKYLLGEVLPKPADSIEKRYFKIMKEMSRSTVGIVEQARREKEEYCDYVESWIHEIETPLTACSLILSNEGDVRRLRRELKRADNLTESILYYARLRTAEKDVKIREFSAAAAIEKAIKSQMELLIGAKISVEASGDFTVCSDEKSVCFILKQLLINCSKYCPGCKVHIRANEGVILVRDNGPGIPAHELPRVTERGFTGSPGRTEIQPENPGRTEIQPESPEQNLTGNQGPASGGTGMGLYIVKELCARLGISLKIESREGEFTCVLLAFDCLQN